MARPIVTLLVALAATVVAVPSEAQWKWKDKSGHVQYSDLPPPPGTSEQDILARPSPNVRRAAPPTTATAATAPTTAAAAQAAPGGTAAAAPGASAAAAPRNPAEAELEEKRKKAEADAAAKAKADQQRIAALRADNCSRAKTQLATLESGVRLAQTNPKTGEREYLDDKQRADEVRRARDVIGENCR